MSTTDQLPLPDDRLRDDVAAALYLQALGQLDGLADVGVTDLDNVVRPVAKAAFYAAQVFVDVRRAAR